MIPSHQVVENSMSAAAKRRVDRATSKLTGKRCLIENTDESNAVEYVHCLPRLTKNGLLDSLEFAWNMPRFTLNVDTRANVIRLSSKFYKLFHSSRWLLLPETSIINAYHNARNKKFPIIDQPSYKYTLLAHQDMRLVPIHRQKSPPSNDDKPPLDFTFYPHPYHDFPVIVSHVHPRFVICNTGAKLIGPTDWPADGRAVDMLKVLNIWRRWSRAVDRGQPDGQAFYMNPRNGNSDVSDNDSVHTSTHRVLRNSLKRNFPEQEGSPMPAPKSSKRQKQGGDGTWLDDETLREFDQQTSTHVEAIRSKKLLILDWLNGIDNVKEQ